MGGIYAGAKGINALNKDKMKRKGYEVFSKEEVKKIESDLKLIRKMLVKEHRADVKELLKNTSAKFKDAVYPIPQNYYRDKDKDEVRWNVMDTLFVAYTSDIPKIKKLLSENLQKVEHDKRIIVKVKEDMIGYGCDIKVPKTAETKSQEDTNKPEDKNVNESVEKDELFEEGVIRRALAKTDDTKKAHTVANYWANAKSLPSPEKAAETIKKYESMKSINAGSLEKFLQAAAAVDYPQGKFIRVVNKVNNKEYPDYMLKNADDSECKKAMQKWKSGKYKIICNSGGGDSLIYSIANGKFFDYFHEQDTGDNFKVWLSEGVTYKDFMSKMREAGSKSSTKNFTENGEMEESNMDENAIQTKEESGQAVGDMLPVTAPDEVFVKPAINPETVDTEFNALNLKKPEDPKYPADNGITEDEDESFEEGVHHDMNVYFKAYMKSYKEDMKAARVLFKSTRYSDAKVHCTRAKETMDKCLQLLDTESIGAGSIIWGNICQSFLDTLEVTLISIITFGIGGYVKIIRDAIHEIRGIIRDLRTGNFGLETCDGQRRRLLGFAEEMSASAQKMIERCDLLNGSSALVESVDDDFDAEAYMEAANQEFKEEFKAAFNTYKTEMKASKNYKKQGKYSDAVAHAKKAKRAMEEAVDKMESIDDTIGDAVIGCLVQGFLSCSKIILASILGFGIGGTIMSIKETITFWSAILEDIKRGNTKIRHYFNSRRNEFIGNAKILITTTDWYITKCNELKHGVATSESAEDEYDLTPYMEGVGNEKIAREFKSAFEAYKVEVKKAHALYKRGKYAEAKKHGSLAKDIMENAIKQMELVDTTVGEAISGLLLQGLINCVKLTIVSILTFGVGSPIESLRQLVYHCLTVYEDMERGNTKVRHWFNLRRSEFISNASSLIAAMEWFISKCEEQERYAITESAEYQANAALIDKLSKECGMRTSFEPVFENGELCYISEESYLAAGNKLPEDYYVEGEDKHIDEDIKPIITKLNDKGYKTIASCSGHPSAREKNDVYRDGVKYGKLYSTARVVFDKIYDFPNIPDGWTKKVMEEDNRVGIYVDPPQFKIINGLPEKQYTNWKRRYMSALEKWVDDLPKEGETKKDDNSEVTLESVIQDMTADAMFCEDILSTF